MKKEALLKQLAFVCDKLNNIGIEYYVVGALGAYIDRNIDLTREHEDIDIMILEKDIDKLKKIFKHTDYTFIDKRKSSTKILNDKGFTEGEEHDVYATLKGTDFHIGFFVIDKDENNYSTIDYFVDNGVQKRLIRTLPIRYFNYQYDDNYKIYNGIKLKTTRLETVYNNKLNMDREKDLYDVRIFEKYINKSIIDKMKGKSKFRHTSIEVL